MLEARQDRAGRRRASALLLALAIVTGVPAGSGAAARVDASTLTGKVIMGYQGWFGCPGDGSGRGWRHWKSGDQFTIDMLPDTSELTPEEKCDSGLKTATGEPVYLFSSQNPLTVDRHFLWMEQYGLDGVALQKFATGLGNDQEERAADKVLDNVRRGAEHHGRVFFLMYDLSGLKPDRLDAVADDWARLNREGLTQSPAYLHHRGKPLLGLWGLGFKGRDLPPARMAALLDRLKAGGQSLPGVTIIGGVPTYWRTNDRDADPDPAWQDVWSNIDVISPWTVGRFHDDTGADRYRDGTLKADSDRAHELGLDFMPVVFPGFSWSHLMHARHEDQNAPLNQIPRRAGRFLKHQITNAAECRMNAIYLAMFDEVDESTAIFKIGSYKGLAEDGHPFLSLDSDEHELPSDWYLEVTEKAINEIRKPIAIENTDRK